MFVGGCCLVVLVSVQSFVDAIHSLGWRAAVAEGRGPHCEALHGPAPSGARAFTRLGPGQAGSRIDHHHQKAVSHL